jgi:hypothetical protein
MTGCRILLVDQGDSILSNLTHQLDTRPVSLADEPVVYAVRNLAESRRLLEKEATSGGKRRPWKVIVIGREGGMEPSATETIAGIRAQFSPHIDIPILLVTKANAAAEAGLRRQLRSSAELLSVDADLDFDLMDTRYKMGAVPEGAEAKFDALVNQQLTAWATSAPEKARSYPHRP